MIRINLHAPGVAETLAVDLAPGRVVLFGRAPDARAVSLPDAPRAQSVVTVSSPRVSGNHLAAWSATDGVHLRDLGSRNGTWVRVPTAGVVVRGDAVQVELASLREADTTPLAAPQARWDTPSEFAPAVTSAVRAWLADVGVDAAISSDGGTTRFHLADGTDLAVGTSLAATQDPRLPALLDVVAGFIDAQNALYEQESGHGDDFVMASPRLREAHRKVFDAAMRGRRTLLLGASGTGKERLAECYHRHSRRADGPFKAVNCALMEKDMIWVQLFGAARGSYTGSVRDVPGAVEAAHGGTLFLDEVADLSPRMQAALLRFLDRSGEYERLGETRVRRADVQIVAATNGDLRGAVARGAFREDLWYRFAGSVVAVPPLRERPEDVLAVLTARKVTPALTARAALSPAALEAVMAHPWPGNFRELENFVSRLPQARKAGAIDLRACREALAEGSAMPSASAHVDGTAKGTQGAWRAVLDAASASWAEDHDGDDPCTWGDLRGFVESYLKPLLAARAAGIDQPGASDVSTMNYSALARQLEVADGTTMRRCIARYVERFAK